MTEWDDGRRATILVQLHINSWAAQDFIIRHQSEEKGGTPKRKPPEKVGTVRFWESFLKLSFRLSLGKEGTVPVEGYSGTGVVPLGQGIILALSPSLSYRRTDGRTRTPPLMPLTRETAFWQPFWYRYDQPIICIKLKLGLPDVNERTAFPYSSLPLSKWSEKEEKKISPLQRRSRSRAKAVAPDRRLFRWRLLQRKTTLWLPLVCIVTETSWTGDILGVYNKSVHAKRWDRNQTSGIKVFKFGWDIAQISLYGDSKLIYDTCNSI